MYFYNPTTNVVTSPGGLSCLLGSENWGEEEAIAAGYYPIQGENPELSMSPLFYVSGYLQTGEVYTPVYVPKPEEFARTQRAALNAANNFAITVGNSTGADTQGSIPLTFTRVFDGTENNFSLATEAGTNLTDPSLLTVSVNSGAPENFTSTGVGDSWVFTSTPAAGFEDLTLELFVDGVQVATLNVPSWLSYFTTAFTDPGSGDSYEIDTVLSQFDLSQSLSILSDRLIAAGY